MLDKSWQEQLQSLFHCDLRSLFPLARHLKRELHFFVGPTNSGKTYSAFNELMQADCGIYLAPLRLLALEGYERLTQNLIPASLVTGEEELINEDATHVCSTIEMLDFSLQTDVVIIDEIQMLDDKDRGWAWINALIGAPAKKIIMTGSVNSLKALQQIAKYLDEPLYVKKFERKNPLKPTSSHISLKNIPRGSALIAFSRADVLRLRHTLSRKYTTSIIYGNLSPEVRKLEAKKFKDHESDILIATDAIAMGLNLPIQTVLFTTDEKFDGISRRKITAAEVAQIAGRAGRFGLKQEGFVGGINQNIQKTIEQKLTQSIPTIKPPYLVKANITQIKLISQFLNTYSLKKILEFYAVNIKFDGPFMASNIDAMLQIARIVDQKNIPLETKFVLSQAPMTFSAPKILVQFKHYLHMFETNQKIRYYPPKNFRISTNDNRILLQAEDEIKLISLYLWLSFKFKDKFVDYELAQQTRVAINQFIELSIQKGIKIEDTQTPNQKQIITNKTKPEQSSYKKNKKRFFK